MAVLERVEGAGGKAIELEALCLGRWSLHGQTGGCAEDRIGPGTLQ